MQKNHQNIFLLERPKKMGLASAYLKGFQIAIEKEYDVVFEMDADFSHNPKYLPEMLLKLKGGADLVIGSRYVKNGGVSNWSRFRLFISRGGNFYARTILRCPVQDMTGGFKGFRVETLKKINLAQVSSGGYSFQIEMNYIFSRLGFKIQEIPIIFEERREGQSKMSKKIFLEAIKQVWKFRRMNVEAMIINRIQ